MAQKYKLQELSVNETKMLSTDDDMKEAYNTVIILSDNFVTEDEDALELDKMVSDWITKQIRATKTQPKTTKTQPKTTKTQPKTTKTQPKTTKTQPKTTKTQPKTTSLQPKTTKKKKEDLIAELLEQLSTNQDEAISPEQIQAIVESVLKTRKICVDDLCDELIKEIKDSVKIEVHLPEYNTKTFNSDTPRLTELIDDYSLGNNIMLIGGAGTGKTFLAEKVADVLGLQHETINCNQFTSPIEINGGQTIEGYQEGKLIKAWSEGKLLILDELPKLDPNTAGILNEALAKTDLDEKDEKAYIVNTKGDRFKKKKGFGVIATGNVYPNTESSSYGANNKQDLSLLDRFAGSVYEIEKNIDLEKKVVLKGHLLIWSVINEIRTLIETNRWEAQVSLRLMKTSLRVYLAEMKGVKKGKNINEERKTFKSVIDSFIWTFTEVQQVEISRKIKYDLIFKNYNYRKLDINKNPF